MRVYRIEHHETLCGPFQSDHYPRGANYESIHPYQWGRYLPVCDNTHDIHYQYQPKHRRWGCHDKTDIMRMSKHDAQKLSRFGWIMSIYEVPISAVFKADSGKQCVFDYDCAVLIITLELIQFTQGNEVEYVPVPD